MSLGFPNRRWRPTPLDFERLTTDVETIEQRTTAEIVLVFCGQSGTYRDVTYLWGLIAATVGTAIIIINPWTEHDPLLLPVENLMLFAGGVIFSTLLPFTQRLLSTPARRAEQVRRAAEARFVHDGVHRTRARTGLLIYLSALERRVEIVPDLGVTAAIAPEVWQTVTDSLIGDVSTMPDTVDALRAALHNLSDVLAEQMPAGDDNPDEIPNRPRVS